MCWRSGAPTIPASRQAFAASRQRQSGQIAPTLNSNAFLYNLFTPQVSVSYVPDVFGLNRRTVESLQAQEQEARFQMIATYTTLTANVVVTAIQEARCRCRSTRPASSSTATPTWLEDPASINSPKAMPAGSISPRRNRSSRRSPPRCRRCSSNWPSCATCWRCLAGRFPSQAPDEKFELSSLQLPEDLPVSLPSELVAQRPDVLQAEANLHAASAKIGIAIANRLPNIVLTANAGSTARPWINCSPRARASGVWARPLTAPIFQGGTLLHQERAAKAAYVQAAEQYRSTVLTAFQNVADTLTALEQDAEALKAAAAAADAAKVTLDLAQRQWQDGYAGYLALLSAEQAYQQSRINLVQAQANRYADTAALFQALGGGWWHRADLAKDKHEK